MPDLTDVTDAEIIAASRSDPERFGTIFDRHAPAVHAFLARRGGGDLADDLLGEVFAVAFRARRRYDGVHASARPWLYGIAHNVLRAHLRRDSQRIRLYRRTEAEPPEDPWADVDRRLDADGPGGRAVHALAKLPAGEREVLQLMAWEGLTVSEAAAALGIPPGTARSRLHRARTALRAIAAVPQTGETS